jgi:uncharacterized membrane protein YraQ (UPF0718 family)
MLKNFMNKITLAYIILIIVIALTIGYFITKEKNEYNDRIELLNNFKVNDKVIYISNLRNNPFLKKDTSFYQIKNIKSNWYLLVNDRGDTSYTDADELLKFYKKYK